MTHLLIGDTQTTSDIRYLLGRHVQGDVIILDTGTTVYVVLNQLEYEDFQSTNSDERIIPVRMEPLIDQARSMEGGDGMLSRIAYVFFQQYASDTAVTVPVTFPVAAADCLRKNGITVSPERTLYPRRQQKSETECRHIEDMCNSISRGLSLVERILSSVTTHQGMLVSDGDILTSEMLKRQIAHEFLDHDCVNESGIIVASGTDSAYPHRSGSGPIYEQTPIVCDLFPRHQERGYYGDLTRTFCVGQPPEKLQAMYSAVNEARQEAIGLIAPGVEPAAVHRRCEEVLRTHGFDVGSSGFIHATGHGVGLDLHEPPSVSAHATEQLQPGNVITIEPGLYYSDIGGVRIEDVIAVTENGARVLSHHPVSTDIAVS